MHFDFPINIDIKYGVTDLKIGLVVHITSSKTARLPVVFDNKKNILQHDAYMLSEYTTCDQTNSENLFSSSRKVNKQHN